jgi:hypothetical protein
MPSSLLGSSGLRCVLALVLLSGAAWPKIASADSVSISASSSGGESSASASSSASSGGPRGLWTSDEKAGRFMGNLKIGPAFLAYPTYGSGVTLAQAALVLEFGYAVTPDRNGYLLFPLNFQMSSFASFISIPIGFQYDIRLPIRGLYLTPRGIIGYTAAISNDSFCNGFGCTATTSVSHLGVFMAEIGVKYVYRGRFNFGFDPFSLPIYFGAPGTSCSVQGCVTSNAVAVFYRLLFYAGANF